MDPYLEAAPIWPDFHDRLITYIASLLQPRLRPRYVALTQDRLYLVEKRRPIYPDVTILENQPAPSWAGGSGDGGVATMPAPVAVADEPSATFEIERETVRETLLHILEPAAGNRVVTAIEVLSPENKATGPGRESYFQKRRELWDAGANLVEIDLLRAGQPTVDVPPEQLEPLRPWHYLTVSTRVDPPGQAVYATPLQRRLPRIAVPLDETPVTLDLQAAVARCWDEGPYPELLGYDGPPPGTLDENELKWATTVAAGPTKPPTELPAAAAKTSGA